MKDAARTRSPAGPAGLSARRALAQKCGAKNEVEFTIVVGDLLAAADVATGDGIAVAEIGIRVVRMVHMVVVVGGKENLAVHAVAVLTNEVARRFRQPGKFLGRIGAVKAVDETPYLRALANELSGEDAEAMDRAPVEIGFDEQHGIVLPFACDGASRTVSRVPRAAAACGRSSSATRRLQGASAMRAGGPAAKGDTPGHEDRPAPRRTRRRRMHNSLWKCRRQRHTLPRRPPTWGRVSHGTCAPAPRACSWSRVRSPSARRHGAERRRNGARSVRDRRTHC